MCLWVRLSFACPEIASAPVEQAGSSVHIFIGGKWCVGRLIDLFVTLIGTKSGGERIKANFT